VNSFEFVYGQKWKQLYEMERIRRKELEDELKESRNCLDADMEIAYEDYKAQLMREGFSLVPSGGFKFSQNSTDLQRRQLELERLDAARRTRMQGMQQGGMGGLSQMGGGSMQFGGGGGPPGGGGGMMHHHEQRGDGGMMSDRGGMMREPPPLDGPLGRNPPTFGGPGGGPPRSNGGGGAPPPLMGGQQQQQMGGLPPRSGGISLIIS
jgi:hypothetical protein